MDKDRLASAPHSTAFSVTCGFTVAFSAASSLLQRLQEGADGREGAAKFPLGWDRMAR